MGEGGSKIDQKSVTYYLNGPLNTLFILQKISPNLSFQKRKKKKIEDFFPSVVKVEEVLFSIYLAIFFSPTKAHFLQTLAKMN